MRNSSRRKAFKILSASVIVALAAAGCSNGTTNTPGGSGPSATSAITSGKVPHKTIGYVDIVASGGMQKRWYNYVTAASKVLGWDVKLVDANGVAATGLKGIQQFVSQGVDAILVSCIDTGPLVPGLAAARAAKIPVIALGCAQPEPVNAFDAVYAEPEQALAEALNAYLVTELKAKNCKSVAVLQDQTILVGRLRSDFFIKALKDSGFNVVATPVIPETSIVPSTRAAILGTMAAHPETCAFVPIFDFSVGPAIASLKSLGKSSSVAVYSYYADNVNLPLLKQADSSLQAVVDGPVEQVSFVAIDQLLAHFMTGAQIDPKAADSLKVDFTIFTKANAPAFATGYLTPWDTATYMKPFIQKWNSTYHLTLE